MTVKQHESSDDASHFVHPRKERRYMVGVAKDDAFHKGVSLRWCHLDYFNVYICGSPRTTTLR